MMKYKIKPKQSWWFFVTVIVGMIAFAEFGMLIGLSMYLERLEKSVVEMRTSSKLVNQRCEKLLERSQNVAWKAVGALGYIGHECGSKSVQNAVENVLISVEGVGGGSEKKSTGEGKVEINKR